MNACWIQRSVFLRAVMASPRRGTLDLQKIFQNLPLSSPHHIGEHSIIHTNLSEALGAFPNFLPGIPITLWGWQFSDWLSNSSFLTWLLWFGIFSAIDSVSLSAEPWLQFQSLHQVLVTSLKTLSFLPSACPWHLGADSSDGHHTTRVHSQHQSHSYVFSVFFKKKLKFPKCLPWLTWWQSQQFSPI